MPRTNESPNPGCKVNTTGWFGGVRTTTLSGTVRSTGYRSNGMGADSVIAAEGDGISGLVYRVSIHVRPTASGTTSSLNIQFYNGGTFRSSTGSSSVSMTSGGWTRISVTATAPTSTTRIRTTVSTTGSGQVDLTGHLLEQTSTLGTYFDGDTAGASWDGASGNSTSTLLDSAAITVTDDADGLDSFAVADARTHTDTADGVDTVSIVDTAIDAPTATVTETGAGTDTASAADSVPSAPDTAVGGDEFLIVDVPFTQLLGFRPGPTYEVVVVARIPQTMGPPALIEVDPIEWSTLKYTNELSQPQQLEVSCLVASVPESIRQRLRKPADLATELWLLRDGRQVFAGPLLGWRRTGKSLSLTAHGLLAYLRLMTVTTDLLFAQVDQFKIVAGLVDHWQNLEHGNYGIDTSTVGVSGVLRDATYLRNERHEIGQRVFELGQRRNGFDIEVDPVSRRLQLWYPSKGVDRSVGEDAVVFDENNITSSSVMCSVAPGDVASDAFGTGTGPSGDTVYSTQADLQLRARFGRSAVSGTWDGVSEQATLDAHVQGLLDARGEALLVPGPNVRITADAGLGVYGVGDTVAYDLDDELGVSGAFRLRSQSVSVSSTGQESASLEFV